MSATARYVFRVCLFGVSAAASSLLTAMPGLSIDDGITAALLGLLGALGYAGIGAASQNVEPTIGRSE
jgi:hypothetical protein